jgi:hypothetical protein
MPVWAWGLIGLGLAVVIRTWSANKASGQQQTDTTVDTTPPTVNQDYITIINPIDTAPHEPPGQGRGEPPTGIGDDRDKPVTPRPPPTRVPDRPTPRPTPKPPAGQWVTVAKWTARNAPWNSTLSGIASHFKIKQWQTVWNLPQNAALKARRKKPELIQPGDKIWVPA